MPTILNFIISLLFLFMLFSLFSSWVVEFFFQQLNKRGEFLRKHLEKVFNEGGTEDWVNELYKKPYINSVLRENNGPTSRLIKSIGNNKRPASSINPEALSKSIVALINEYGGESISKKIDAMPESGLKTLLKSMVSSTDFDEKRLIEQFNDWYGEFNARVTYWYKDNTRFWLFFIGLALAIGFNVDMIEIGQKLWRSPELSKEIAIQAAATANEIEKSGITAPETLAKSKEMLIAYQANQKLPIGWVDGEIQWCGILKNYKWLGFLIAAFSVTLGATFWYDALRKVLSLKSGKTSSSSSNTTT